MRTKRAIFGGTFDPIHWGHLTLAEGAMQQISLAQVIWVPDRDSPHKALGRATYFHRCQMVQRAIAPYPYFTLSPLLTPRYSIHTFEALKQIYPESDWYWILGLDTFQTLPRWYQRQDLIPHLHWLVAPRPSPHSPTREWDSATQQVVQQLQNQGISLDWQALSLSPLEISSSAIRQHYQNQSTPHPALPPPVQVYIAHQNLYSTSPYS